MLRRRWRADKVVCTCVERVVALREIERTVPRVGVHPRPGRMRVRWFASPPTGTIGAMDVLHARCIAQLLHAEHREPDGTPLLDHIRRVARQVPIDAQVVAWLHEALTWSGIAEHHLLMEGLASEELRALRLLDRVHDARSEQVYLAHLHLIANAAGEAGHMARTVKIADLQDRCVHPRLRADGWTAPYARGLDLLAGQLDPARDAGRIAAA